MPSRTSAHKLGVDAVRYSFIVMDLHHLLLAGLPGALRFAPNSRHKRRRRHVPFVPKPEVAVVCQTICSTYTEAPRLVSFDRPLYAEIELEERIQKCRRLAEVEKS